MNTLFVFLERDFRAQTRAHRGDGSQKILVDLGFQHVDFLERCLHLGQTFGDLAPLLCRQRWQNRGEGNAAKDLERGSGPSDLVTFPRLRTSRWQVPAQSQVMAATAERMRGFDHCLPAFSQSRCMSGGQAGSALRKRCQATTCILTLFHAHRHRMPPRRHQTRRRSSEPRKGNNAVRTRLGRQKGSWITRSSYSKCYSTNARLATLMSLVSRNDLFAHWHK